MPKFLAQSLALEAGYRYTDYNLGFKTNTYKLGLEWSPISPPEVRAKKTPSELGASLTTKILNSERGL